MGLVNHMRLSTLCQTKMEHALYATDLFLYQRIKRIFQHWEIMRKKVTDNAFPGKYYLRTTSGNPSLEFVDALIHGCDYGYIGDDENATVLYDDGAWSNSDNNVVTFWQLSHTKCGIIITANTLCEVLKLKENELTEAMIEDVKKYWCIKDLAVTRKEDNF